MDVVLVTCTLGAAAVLAGVPLGAAVRGRETSPAAWWYDAAVAGLVWWLLWALGLVRVGRFTPGWLAVGLVVPWACVAVDRVRRALVPTAGRADPWALATAATLVGALLLRLQTIEWVHQTGDMGEYVNKANLTARGVELVESFPHLFTVFLAIPARLFGTAHTVDVLPLAGLLLIGGVLRLAGLIGAGPALRLGAAVFLAVHAVPVWFSQLPVSETLHAALVAALLVTVAAVPSEGAGRVVAAGAVALALGLLRGNALLLVPVAAVAAVMAAAVIVEDDRRTAARRWRRDGATAAAVILGVGAAYAYNVRWLPDYYLDKQLSQFVPGRAYSAAGDLGLLEVGVPLAVAVVAAAAAVVAATEVTGRLAWSRSPERRGLISRPGAAPVAAVAGGAVAVTVLGSGAVVEGFSHIGLVLPAAAAGGLAVALRRPGPRRPPGGVPVALWPWAALLAAAYVVLHAQRFGAARGSFVYLYWDRYLFSEVYPALAALAVVGLAGARDLGGVVAGRWRPVLGGALAVVTTVGGVNLVRSTAGAVSGHMFGAEHAALVRIDTALRRDIPLAWGSADGTVPEGWYFHNTYRAYALPVAQTLGRWVVGLPDAPFDPDPVRTPEEIRRWVSVHGAVYVAEEAEGGVPLPDRLAAAGAVDLVVERATRIPMEVTWRSDWLDQGPRWRSVSFPVDVWLVTAGAAPSGEPGPPEGPDAPSERAAVAGPGPGS